MLYYMTKKDYEQVFEEVLNELLGSEGDKVLSQEGDGLSQFIDKYVPCVNNCEEKKENMRQENEQMKKELQKNKAIIVNQLEKYFK